MNSNKKKIKMDFDNKQNTYYKNNYTTKSNKVRQLRNSLINEKISSINQYTNVLDAGCGPAILFEAALKNSTCYYALDLVESNLNKIKEMHGINTKVKYIQSDIDSYQTDNNHDLIICSGSLEYTDHPYNNVLKLASILNEGGTLIASFPNLINPYRLWAEYVYKFVSKILNSVFHKNKFYYKRKLFSNKKLLKILNLNGYGDVQSIYFGVNIFIQPFDKLLSQLNNLLSKKLENKDSSLSRFLSTEFLLIISKD